MKIIIQHLKQEFKSIVYINKAGKAWQLSAILALCTGVPLFIGTFFGHFEFGIVSSIGGMAAFYLQKTPLIHRVVVLLCVSAGISASFFLGLIVEHFPYFLVPSIALISIIATIICRFFKIPPPANYFFVMAASIAAFIPNQAMQMPTMVGLVFLGSLFSVILIFVYSLISLRINPNTLDIPGIETDFQIVIVDSVIIGLTIGISLFISQLLGMQKPYWVALTCLAIIQGMTFSAIWSRHLQRMIGTFIGIFLTWLILNFNLNLWHYSIILTVLSFLVQFLSARNYTLSTVFVTPLTIFLAEYAHKNTHSDILVDARLFDTILGAVLGVVAGIFIHNKSFRHWFTRILKVVIPYKIQ